MQNLAAAVSQATGSGLQLKNYGLELIIIFGQTGLSVPGCPVDRG